MENHYLKRLHNRDWLTNVQIAIKSIAFFVRSFFRMQNVKRFIHVHLLQSVFFLWLSLTVSMLFFFSLLFFVCVFRPIATVWKMLKLFVCTRLSLTFCMYAVAAAAVMCIHTLRFRSRLFHTITIQKNGRNDFIIIMAHYGVGECLKQCQHIGKKIQLFHVCIFHVCLCIHRKTSNLMLSAMEFLVLHYYSR